MLPNKKVKAGLIFSGIVYYSVNRDKCQYMDTKSYFFKHGGEHKMGAFEILTGAATVVGSFVKLADTPAAKRIWEGIKSFFKGTGASPPENNPGDMISVDVLKTILSLVREDKLQELVREAESDKSGGTVRNFTVSATSGGVVSQGDNATIYFSSSPPPSVKPCRAMPV